ncbi:MAG: beta-lactamase family protein [bacterium]|nr:beta-lactamase family protein [bacterium]
MKRFLSLLFLGFLFSTFFISQLMAQSLPLAKPEEVGISSSHLNQVKTTIQEAIDHKDFPGATILVARKGKIVLREAFGASQWIPEKRAMKIDMMFDLASITKPVATATSVMILVEQGKIRLWDKVKDFVPDFSTYTDEAGKSGEDARIWHLLTHTSGLPPYTNAKEVERKFGSPCPTDSLVKHIAQLKKTDPPGKAFHYSCLGFITLAHIIHQISGQSVAEFSAQHIFKPLKMNHTFYNPPEQFRSLCVPTEVIDGKPLIGVVHDPLARLQSGISGNATVDDLAIFAQMMLNKGEFQGTRILSPLTVERMTEVHPAVSFSGRGLGWDLDSDYSTNGGDIFGHKSFGHTGYTGTSIWIDPETETFVIFLTNRAHPDDKGAIISLRSRVANIVASAIR